MLNFKSIIENLMKLDPQYEGNTKEFFCKVMSGYPDIILLDVPGFLRNAKEEVPKWLEENITSPKSSLTRSLISGNADHYFENYVYAWEDYFSIIFSSSKSDLFLSTSNADDEEENDEEDDDSGLSIIVAVNWLKFCGKENTPEQFIKDFSSFLTTLMISPGKKKIQKGTIQLLGKNPSGLELVNIPEVVSVPLIEENYTPDVYNAHKHVIKEIASKTPNGKIAIYQGPPGTGKTYAVRNLISQLENCYVVLIPPSMVKELGSPSLLTMLLRYSKTNLPIIFVLEDADEILTARDKTNQSGISTLLNLGDGILGSIIDARIIASTNLAIDNFDEAVTRSGRLIELIRFDYLKAEQAREIVVRQNPSVKEEWFAGTIFEFDDHHFPIRLSDCYEFASNDRNGLSNKKYLRS